MTLSKDIIDVFKQKNSSTVLTFGQIVDKIKLKGFAFLLVILSLPSALPIPAPGYSTPFGFAIIFIAIQIITNKTQPWFPERVLKQEIKMNSDSKLLNFMVKFLEFFEKFLKPRFQFLYKNLLYRQLIGFLILICAFSMLIPLPLTNTAPAFAIFLMSLGMLEEDGLIGFLGVFLAILGVGLASLIVYFFFAFGPEYISNFTSQIKSWVGL